MVFKIICVGSIPAILDILPKSILTKNPLIKKLLLKKPLTKKLLLKKPLNKKPLNKKLRNKKFFFRRKKIRLRLSQRAKYLAFSTKARLVQNVISS